MFSINRSALIIKPKPALHQWLDRIYPDAPPFTPSSNPHDNAEVYLLPDFIDISETIDWLQSNLEYFFENQLYGYCTDPELWPRKRDWKTFNQFFKFSIQSIVHDTLDTPIERTSLHDEEQEEISEELLQEFQDYVENEQEDPGLPLQFNVSLQHAKTPTWRRLQIGENATFMELHMVLQIAFGFKNAHLHEFRLSDRRIGLVLEDDDEDMGLEDGENIRLSDLHFQPGDTFTYLYDFGDSWTFTVEVEPVKRVSTQLPVVLAGRTAGPPEDVGGVVGLEMLEIALHHPEHPQHQDFREQFGLNDSRRDEESQYYYHPKQWSKEEINEVLSSLPLIKFMQDRGMF